MVDLWWGAGVCVQATKGLALLVLHSLWLCWGWTSSSAGSWRWRSLWLTPGRASWSDNCCCWNHLRTWSCMANGEEHQRQVKALFALVFVFINWIFCHYVHKPYDWKEACAESLVGSLSGVLHFLIAYLFRDKPVILMQYMVNACSLKVLISVNTWIQEVTLLLCILKILESLVVIILQVSNQLP